MKKALLFTVLVLVFVGISSLPAVSAASERQGTSTMQKVHNVAVKKVNPKKDNIRIRVSWKKEVGADRYQVQLLKKCSTCTKKIKIIDTYGVANTKKLRQRKRPYTVISRKVKKFKKNKEYAVRVRDVKGYGDARTFGRWSEKEWFVARRNEGTCKAPSAPSTANPDTVVGNGTSASCTQKAFKNAVAAGGTITFNCGAAPHTIKLTSVASANTGKNTIIDGGGLISLSGSKSTRILELDTGNFEATSPTLIVMNLTFRNGRSTASDRYNDDGDYLGADEDGGGGAIYYYGGNVRSFNNTFINNRCPSWGPDLAGGGIYGIGEGRTTIVKNHFERNSCANGGAVGGLHTSIKIYNSTIINNKALGKGANYQDENNVQQGHGGNGGGILMDGDEQQFKLCGSVVSGNKANALGGGMFRTTYRGGGTMRINRSIIKSNYVTDKENPNDNAESSNGGGIYFEGGLIEITNSVILRNSAHAFGGLQLGGSPTTMEFDNVKVDHNVSRESLAGGVWLGEGVTGSIRNSSISFNRAPEAFAAATAGGGETGVVLANTKILHNTAGNPWNPQSCYNQFIEGGGNYQYPVVRPNGESDYPDNLCSPNMTIEDVK
ncbi:hypothetical protein ACFL2M_02225 [Patescibacteria group bacterium]